MPDKDAFLRNPGESIIMNVKAGAIILAIGLVLSIIGGYMLFVIPDPTLDPEDLARYLFDWFLVFYLGLGLTAFGIFYLAHGYYRRYRKH